MTMSVIAAGSAAFHDDGCMERSNAAQLAGELRETYAQLAVVIRDHLFRPASRQASSDQLRFERLCNAWKATEGPSSFIRDRAMHPSYQSIIGMGERAVPLILAELKREPDHWFWALKAITGADPVPVEYRGDLAAMTAAWLEWGRRSKWIQ